MAKNDSFFNEIYGTYFNVVSSILRQAQEKQLTKDSLELLVREQAFADSCLTPSHCRTEAGRCCRRI